LVIESTKGNTIHARFDFDFVPRHESGSFELTGKFDPETQGVTLAAGAWISKPGPTWKTVSMDGFVDASGREYSGLIASSGCGSFSVVK
jgi:hypothetical protein